MLILTDSETELRHSAIGPKQVIVITGVNKIMHSDEAAIERARNVAAPINMQRFTGKVTPSFQKQENAATVPVKILYADR